MNGTGIRALVVEDSLSWQQIVAELLMEMGMHVDIADSYKSAVEALHRAPHRIAVIDLALGDGDVDNQDGLRVLEVVPRLDPGCVSLMLTGYATVDLAVSALTQFRAFSFLEKSAFNRAEFRDLVYQALASAPVMEAKSDSGVTENVSVPSSGHPEQVLGTPILVVEDDAGWRGILAEILGEVGCSVKVCSGFGEALGYLQRDGFSLAVVDLNLDGIPPDARDIRHINDQTPHLDGTQLLSKLCEQNIPAIVVSGLGAPASITRIFNEYGIFAFLEKQTFNRQTFLDTVLTALAVHRIPEALAELTERELEVLELLAQGATNNAIAQTLFISANTVKRHLKAIFHKLGVHTRAAATAKAIQARQS
jgi:two-component system nitrate/nitrite response regulator NarP